MNILNKIVKAILLRNENKLSNISGSWTYLHDNGWLEAIQDCDNILHVASPNYDPDKEDIVKEAEIFAPMLP